MLGVAHSLLLGTWVQCSSGPLKTLFSKPGIRSLRPWAVNPHRSSSLDSTKILESLSMATRTITSTIGCIGVISVLVLENLI